MNHGRFHKRVGSRTKVALLSSCLSGLLLVTVPMSSVVAMIPVVSLPAPINGFLQTAFTDFSGITLSGQTLPITFVFENGPIEIPGEGSVLAELLLQTGPHGASGDDYPYNQYVVFESGSVAYLLDENGAPLAAPLSDWVGGRVAGPGPTSGMLSTTRGWAGADMLAYPSRGMKVGGIHYDLVLPDTGETLYSGRIGVRFEALALGVTPGDATAEPTADSSGEPTGEPTAEPTVEPAAASSVSLPVNSPTPLTSFDIPNLGGVAGATDGSGQLSIGYGHIQAEPGYLTPSGLAVFEYWQGSTLVSETLVPSASLLTSGRIYAEVSADGLLSTAIAMANPNSEDATIDFELRNAYGSVFQMGKFTLKGAGASCESGTFCNHMATFIDQYPFFSGPIQGTLTFTSSVPVSVIALRAHYNERTPRDFLMSPLPVVDLSVGPQEGPQVIPLFSTGGGMTTQILLVNPTGTPLDGSIQFLDAAGVPKEVTVDAELSTTFGYYVAPNSSTKLLVAGSETNTESGSVRVVPGGVGVSPVSLAVLIHKPGDFTVSEASVPATMGTAFRLYTEFSVLPQVLSGVAIANTTGVAGTVTLTLTRHDGEFVATSEPLPLSPYGQIMGFTDQLFPGLATDTMRALLRITTDLPGISAVGLRGRVNDRLPAPDLLLSTVPPVWENGLPGSEDGFFPLLVNGQGFRTRMILYSGTSGQESRGNMQTFAQPNGSPLHLPLQ